LRRATDALDELVDGVRNRDEAAFGSVYRLTASGLLSFANGMLRDRQAAEDAVQQAFLELTRAAPSLRGDGRSLRAWLYRSVRFTCLDEVRRRSRHPESPRAELPDAGVLDRSDRLDPDLQDALMALKERQRALIVLRHVIDLTPDEIATVLGTNRTAVYAALARAERKLQKLMTTVESAAPPASHTAEARAEQGPKP
jgi:RNA polymerase sigma-70 factor (ECF subfamily)